MKTMPLRNLMMSALLLTPLALVATGCPDPEPQGDGDGDGDGDGEDLSNGALLARFAAAAGDAFERCWTNVPAGDFYDDVQGGHEVPMPDYIAPQLASIEAMILDPAVAYDAAQFAACIALYEAAMTIPCGEVDTVPINETCGLIFAGTVAEGGSCDNGAQCLSGECDLPPIQDSCGVCVAAPAEVPPAQAGEPCQNAQDCAGDLSCAYDVDADEELCVALPGLGESCATLWCDGDLECDDNDICVSPAALGESCADVDCSVEGDALVFCNADDVCEAAIDGAAAGDACTPYFGSCGGYLDTGLICKNAADNESATCVAIVIAELGEPCQLSSFVDVPSICRGQYSTSACVNVSPSEGECVARPVVGESCAELSCNAQVGLCGEGDVCAAFPAAGEACIANACAPDMYCIDNQCLAADELASSFGDQLMCVEP